MKPIPHITPPTDTVAADLLRPVLRLRLKPSERATGFVDGAWWPHSAELVTELPDMLTALSARVGRIARVSYQLRAWGAAPRRLAIAGGVVRLEGFGSQPANTVGVTAYDGKRVALLVVPAHATDAAARYALMTASEPDNTDTVAALLAGQNAPPATPLLRESLEANEQRRDVGACIDPPHLRSVDPFRSPSIVPTG